MSLFVFTNPVDPLRMEGGKMINGYDSLEWIDRYRESGEFTIVSPHLDAVEGNLHVGSYIGRTGSQSLMIVENIHSSEGGDDSQVTITGRSYDAFLENRIVGNDQPYSILGGIKYADTGTKYVLPGTIASWTQIAWLVRQHVQNAYVTHETLDVIPYFEIMTDVDGLPDNRAGRELDRKTLYAAVQDLLAIDSCGIKSIRPGIWSPAASPDSTVLVVHRGTDRRDAVSFTYDNGDIDHAEILSSIRAYKNCAMVTGKWIDVQVDPSGLPGGERRMMVIDATDIDEQFDAAPTDDALTLVVAAMFIRGKEALAKQRRKALASVSLNRSATTFSYGRDYNTGDIVSILGGGVTGSMRVIEYVYFEDSTGVAGYPTLSDINEESA